jgi:hypothetical protein
MQNAPPETLSQIRWEGARRTARDVSSRATEDVVEAPQKQKKKKRKARFFQLPRDACKFGEFIVIVVINIPCRLMWRTFSRKIDCSFRLLAARVFKLLLPMPV